MVERGAQVGLRKKDGSKSAEIISKTHVSVLRVILVALECQYFCILGEHLTCARHQPINTPKYKRLFSYCILPALSSLLECLQGRGVSYPCCDYTAGQKEKPQSYGTEKSVPPASQCACHQHRPRLFSGWRGGPRACGSPPPPCASGTRSSPACLQTAENRVASA